MSTTATNDVSFGTGAGVGAAAWVVGVVLTFIIGQLGISQGLSFLIAMAPIQGSLLAYQGIHTWFISGTGGGGIFMILTLVPILILIGAGYYVASQERGDNGFMTGASVAAGYLAMTVLGLVILLVMGGGAINIVDALIGIILAGVVFPVVFGGIGGLVAEQA